MNRLLIILSSMGAVASSCKSPSPKQGESKYAYSNKLGIRLYVARAQGTTDPVVYCVVKHQPTLTPNSGYQLITPEGGLTWEQLRQTLVFTGIHEYVTLFKDYEVNQNAAAMRLQLMISNKDALALSKKRILKVVKRIGRKKTRNKGSCDHVKTSIKNGFKEDKNT